MSAAPTIVWFRQDLRLDDNPALLHAVARSGPVIPVYIQGADGEGEWTPGAASKWWIHQSLAKLDESLCQRGSRLLIRRGKALPELRRLVKERGAGAVVWNRRHEPASIARDTAVKEALAADGIDCKSFNSALLWEPWTIKTQGGTPYKVYSPFWRACQAAEPPAEPLPAPSAIPSPETWPASLELHELELEPNIDWAGGIAQAWQPGETGALKLLERFLEGPVGDYGEQRNRPDLPATSRLSPYLHHGEISPRRIWLAVQQRLQAGASKPFAKGAEKFLSEVAWREFGYHLLYHFPETPLEPLRPEFDAFPWADDPAGLRRWQKGETGYPIVDAGMRELWTTGWMHNRVRMIVASFLVKDLFLPWQEGAKWFWDTLVDADLANNTLGWQWAAGSGADAAPYFRIFNPVTQGERFDPDGAYVRRWVPEIARLSNAYLHKPWEAPMKELSDAGARLGTVYPAPIVQHSAARERALSAWEDLKARR